MEILSPAGSPEAVRAAVCAGANAVYLGYGSFNARRNAKNFTPEEVAEAVSYCHLHGVKLYLTLNTLVNDREMAEAAELATHASKIGMDAVLVQDLGVLRMLRQVAPDLPVHASTQMSVHNLDGVKAVADLGITRAVLARELSGKDIAYICEHSPIEIETFVHGALCMCHSGQCYMSSVIGGRSGNRGLCAQPCRLTYGWGDRADSYPLSLKDASMAHHLQEFQRMGVACVKIEGRMKRPEYVWVVTKVYADALREGRDPTDEEMRRLAHAFSRQGFTDGYFRGETGPDMFGVRENTPEPHLLFAEARSAYKKGEGPGSPVKLYAMIRSGEPVQVGVEDSEGRVATAAGEIPEAARKHAITQEEVETQLSKTGGTPYLCTGVRSLVEDGLSVPLSALNGLRRQVLEDLSAQRVALPERRHNPYSAGARYENPQIEPKITVSLRKASQLSFELQRQKPDLVYLPTDEIAADTEKVKEAMGRGIAIAASLPRVCFDRELPELERQLNVCKELGITEVLAGNIGLARYAKDMGFEVRGDFGLQLFNSNAAKEYKRLGFKSLTASFELKLAQIRDLSKMVDTELIAYGRLPLMITENCIVHNHSSKHTCANVNLLTDRKGVRFPVVKAWGCRNEILNANKLFMADKAADFQKIGLWAIRLVFTTENGLECAQVLERYRGKGEYTPTDFTRGLYYRDVE